MSEVGLSRRAVKDLDALAPKIADRVLRVIEDLGADPNFHAHDVKALVGRRPWRRLRVGNHRVLFRLSQGGVVLLVGRIVDRKDLERAVRTLPD